MPASQTRLTPNRRKMITLAALVVVLFVIANLTANSASHPGTVSNIAFIACLLGVLLLIAAVIGARRSRSR